MRRLLLVLLPLVLAAACVWFWRRAQDASASVPALEPDPERGALVPQPERGPEIPAPHAAATRIAAAPSAASAPATSRPAAEGPEYEVLVLDAATRAPVAGADVWWSDATSGMVLPDVPSSQRPFRLSDSEQFARGHGWHTRADARGRARVRGRFFVTVHARADGRYGSTGIRVEEAAPGSLHQIELRADRRLRVRVVDSSNAPVAGVPVAIAVHGSDGRFLRIWPTIATRSDAPDGIAEYPHLQTWRLRDGQEPPPATWRVRTQLPGYADPGVAFDPRSPPAEPLVLRVPPCGSLVVRLEHCGRPLPRQRVQGPNVVLELPGGRPEIGMLEWFQWADAGAEVRFAAVPIERTFTVRMRWHAVQCEQSVVGPGVQGQEVTAVLSLPNDLAGLSGRLMGQDRQPLRDTSANVDFAGSPAGGGTEVSTDGEGCFLLLLGPHGPDAQIRSFRLWRQLLDGPRFRAEITPRRLTAGVLDVGDVVFAPSPDGR